MSVIKKDLKATLVDPRHQESNNAAFVLDEQGKEVQITASMIKQSCRILLQRCRTVQTTS
jgi:hypothetical protein